MSEKSKTIESSSIDNEMMVLGSILGDPKNAPIGLKLVISDDFFDPKHKIIIKAIQDVFQEKEAVDVHLVSIKLKTDDKIKEAGGLPYLITLAQYAGTSCHIEAYCEDLKKLTLKRRLISLNNSLSTDLQQGADESKIIEKFKEQIKDIEKHKSQAESSFRYLLDYNSEKKLVEELKNVSPGVSTGFTIGDENITIPGGAISVIAMPTSHGKTATLINFALGVLNHYSDKSIYFFTYEESGASIISLFLNTWIGKDISRNNRESILSHFRNGNVEFISTDMRAEFLDNKKGFFKNIIDSGRLRVFYSDMRVEILIAAIHFLRKNTNVGLVCIDYMQLLHLLRFQGNRQEELKQICLMLKDCAVETGLPILLGAQFSRQVTCEADLSVIYIREAADIEHIANLVIGGWNRNFEGFTREGNISKKGMKVPKESSIYFEIMKGRGIGNGHNSVMDFNGNTGRISNRINNDKSNIKSSLFG